jgi:acetyltransferase-like isoleucine patch superfamily enzyme
MIAKLRFFLQAKRLGPDMPLTHMLLHSKRLGTWLCRHKFACFGEKSEFRAGAYAVNTHRISIGKQVVIRPGTMLFASQLGDLEQQITIEDYVLIGSGVHIYVSNHVFTDPTIAIYFQGHAEVQPVRLGYGCWIGANAIILPGVTVGKNAVIGAGSVVTRSVPDFAVVVGNPARVIRLLTPAETTIPAVPN